jgi:acyl carrier protein
MSPKVKGLFNLARLIEEQRLKLDFLAVFSSFVSLFGNIKQRSNYAAASTFEDIFALSLGNNKKLSVKIINWGYWENSRTSNKESDLNHFRDNKLISMSWQEGLEAFKSALASSKKQLAITKTPLAFFENKIPISANSYPLYPRPELTTSYLAPLNNIQEQLISLWQELFGYEQIGINDNFFDLGGDSLKAVQIVSQINQKLKANISVATIFNNPTIKNLSVEIKKIKPIIKKNKLKNLRKFIKFSNNLKTAG